MLAVDFPEDIKKKNHTCGRMFRAILRVIEDQSIPSVRGFLIPVVIENNVFSYVKYTHVYSHQFIENPFKPNKDIPFGSNQEGGYLLGFSFGNYQGDMLVAIFFPQGNFGMIFIPDKNGIPTPKKYANLTPFLFEQRIFDEYSIEIINPFTTAKNILDYSKSELDKNNFTKAKLYLEIVESRFGEDFTLYSEISFLFIKLKEYEKSIKYLSAALQHNENNFMLWYNRGAVYFILGENDFALQDMSKSIEINSKHILAFQARARIYERLGDLEKSETDAQRANELENGL
jgi:tetratricopeptide (TPR) repeat protein